MAKPKVVLCAEDDPAIQQMITDCLTDQGYTVRRGYGESALADAQAHPPDLVLLDMWQPGDTGPYQTFGERFIATLKANPPTAHTPIIVVTAWDAPADKALALGAELHLRKPFDIDVLITAVKAAIGPQAVAKE